MALDASISQYKRSSYSCIGTYWGDGCQLTTFGGEGRSVNRPSTWVSPIHLVANPTVEVDFVSKIDQN